MGVGAPVAGIETELEHPVGHRPADHRKHRKRGQHDGQPAPGDQHADQRQRHIGVLFHAERPDVVERTGAVDEDADIIIGEGERGERRLPFIGDEGAGEEHHAGQHEHQQRRVDARETPLEESF